MRPTSTVVANEIPKYHSKASRGVLESGCTLYNCINAAVSARIALYIQYATTLHGASGATATACTVSSDFQNFIGHDCSMYVTWWKVKYENKGHKACRSRYRLCYWSRNTLPVIKKMNTLPRSLFHLCIQHGIRLLEHAPYDITYRIQLDRAVFTFVISIWDVCQSL